MPTIDLLTTDDEEDASSSGEESIFSSVPPPAKLQRQETGVTGLKALAAAASSEKTTGQATKYRNFAFTLNNPTPEQEAYFRDEIKCRYIVVGHEVGKRGTPHLQGQVCFEQPKTFRAFRNSLPEGMSPHIEPTIDLHASIEYCKKDAKFFERGKAPISNEAKGQMEKDRWVGILAGARSGEFETLPAQVQFTHARTLDYIYRREQARVRLANSFETMHWYCGPSGTGKSRKARETWPEAYLKACNRWWDGYTDQETVLIEDFDRAHDGLCHHLKLWADIYPFAAEVKGGTVKIRPRRIVVTSNYHPSAIWTADEDLEPILRRFKVTVFNRPLMEQPAPPQVTFVHPVQETPRNTPALPLPPGAPVQEVPATLPLPETPVTLDLNAPPTPPVTPRVRAGTQSRPGKDYGSMTPGEEE